MMVVSRQSFLFRPHSASGDTCLGTLGLPRLSLRAAGEDHAAQLCRITLLVH